MKIILLLLLLFPINCNAEEHYTDYYFFEESENYYEATSLLKREERTLYLNYKYEISNEGYYPLDEEFDELSYVDKDDYIIIDNEESKKSTYLYIEDYEKIKYIKLSNFNGNLTKINYVLTRMNNELAPWDLQHINCHIKEIVQPESIILLKLRETYSYENFKIIIAIISTSETDFSFDLGISEDDKTYKNFNINISNADINDEHVFYFTNVEENAGINFSESITLYKYYDLEKIYTDKYSEEPLLDHYHDLQQSKIIYTYYKRDKLDLVEEQKEEEIKKEEQKEEEQKEELEIKLENKPNESTNLVKGKTKEKGVLTEKLKLKNTTKNNSQKDSIIDEKQTSNEQKTKEKTSKILNHNLLIVFVVASTIKSVLKKKKII